jgi:hypothetical protein
LFWTAFGNFVNRFRDAGNASHATNAIAATNTNASTDAIKTTNATTGPANPSTSTLAANAEPAGKLDAKSA